MSLKYHSCFCDTIQRIAAIRLSVRSATGLLNGLRFRFSSRRYSGFGLIAVESSSGEYHNLRIIRCTPILNRSMRPPILNNTILVAFTLIYTTVLR